jgi:hypothetical protein
MIRYSLRCASEHEFEGWFANSSAYDKQRDAKQLLCPICGSGKVEKAVMAPSIVSGKSAPHPMKAPPAGKPTPEEAVQFMRELKTFIEKNTDDVGPRFAEEALKIHYEEAEARSIRGEATRDELEELRDEGVEVFPLPILPDDHN